MVYENKDQVFKVADNIYNDLVKASKQLGIRIEEPYWIEMDNEKNRQELERDYPYVSSKGVVPACKTDMDLGQVLVSTHDIVTSNSASELKAAIEKNVVSVTVDAEHSVFQ